MQIKHDFRLTSATNSDKRCGSCKFHLLDPNKAFIVTVELQDSLANGICELKGCDLRFAI